MSRVRPQIHAQRSPHQTRTPSHDHKENSLLAGGCSEPEQDGGWKNTSVKTWPCPTKHAGTCQHQVDTKTLPSYPLPGYHREQPSTIGCCYYTHGNEKKKNHALDSSPLKCSFVHFFSRKDCLLNLILLICMHPRQSLCMKFVLYISFFSALITGYVNICLCECIVHCMRKCIYLLCLSKCKHKKKPL